ncbi:MAG: tRNA lysidine(34) synthetase TilS [Acidobacteria bacterium]|nr:MAG: tRNA lysidine(34) synthetase TilS [Acidobacteriota bacterium]
MTILETLGHFFRTTAPVSAGDRLLVAFSGGTDSTALLWGAAQYGRDRGLEVRAHHLDHGLDPSSSHRAEAARRLSEQVGVPFASTRLEVPRHRAVGESLEEASRRLRYRQLEAERRELGARYILTAHHADDQIETVLLRLLFGSGIDGLSGISPRLGHIARPFLDLTRAELRRTVEIAGLRPLDDPSNSDMGIPRNRIRHRLLPHLQGGDPQLGASLLRLAAAARRGRRAIETRLASRLRPRVGAETVEVRRRDLEMLPEPLWPHALAMLHRQAGSDYPPTASARRDLYRQCRESTRVGCDCGDGWRWESRGELLRLGRPAPPTPAFAYTFEVPGEHWIPELELKVLLRRGEVADWMFQNAPQRAGLALPLRAGERVMVRNRRPGDRIQPLGFPCSRRLKGLLMDRGVPRDMRDRLPLLLVDDRLAWIPGIAIDNAFQVSPGDRAWIAEIEPQ